MKNEIQNKLDELKLNGWTLASIARAIGQSSRAVESWNQGLRSPANLKSVLVSLNKISEYKRIPKKKLYIKGSRKGDNTNDNHISEKENY
jgi:transcriptional regulator with XRE-family HTH domain